MSRLARNWLLGAGAAVILAGIALVAIGGTDRQPAAGPPVERIIWTVRRDRLRDLGDAVETFGRSRGIEVFRSPALPLNISVGFKTFMLHVANTAAAKNFEFPFVSVDFVRLEGIGPDTDEMTLVRRELETYLGDFEGLEFSQVGESR